MNACVARTPSLDLTPDRLEEPLHGVSANRDSIKQLETLRVFLLVTAGGRHETSYIGRPPYRVIGSVIAASNALLKTA